MSKTQWTVYSLTTAELRVLHYLPTNLTLSDIADRLFVSRNTAKSHAASIYRKLGTKRRGEAVKIAEAAGLLTLRRLAQEVISRPQVMICSKSARSS